MHPDTVIDLWLIRHGEAEHNLDKNRIGGGRHDGQLTEDGGAQAAGLGDYLADSGVSFDAIHASAMQRAIQTAHILKSRLGYPGLILEHAEFNELDQGELEYMTREEAYTPRRRVEMSHRGMDFRPPGGESQRELQRRAWSKLEELVVHNGDLCGLGTTHRIAIVAHKVTINVLLQGILGSERALCWRQSIHNTAFSRFWFTADGWWPNCINSTPHLDLRLDRANRTV